MTMHPLTANDVAKARSEEKLARALEAYRFLDAHESRDWSPSAGLASAACSAAARPTVSPTRPRCETPPRRLRAPHRRPPRRWVRQLTAFRTSAAIFFSSAGVSSSRANDVGHIVPASIFAWSLKPNVAYLESNLAASWK